MSAQTPDRFPGSLGEEEVILDEQTEDPSQEGAVRYVNGSFRVKDEVGVFGLRSESEGFDIDNCIFDSNGWFVFNSEDLVVTRD